MAEPNENTTQAQAQAKIPTPNNHPGNRNRWLLERLLFLFPPVIGVGIIGVLREANVGVALLDRGLVLLSTTGYTLLTVGVTVVVVADAWAIRAKAKNESPERRRGQNNGRGQSRSRNRSQSRRRKRTGWHPNPVLYGLAALVWAPATGILYLYRRHRHYGTPAGRSEWWVVIAIALCATFVGTATATIAVVLVMPTLFATTMALIGTIAFGVFPVAIYQDAAYVCAQSQAQSDSRGSEGAKPELGPEPEPEPGPGPGPAQEPTRTWTPNPSTYLGLAFCSLFLPLLQPVVAAYYLGRRRGALGTP